MARGFNVDQNQVNNATNQELQRLSPLASAATNSAQTAQNLAGQYVTQGMAQNQVNLLPVQAQQQLMSDQFARQMTGYSEANQAELQGLMQKMQSGVALSTAEMARANQLATSETSYNTALIGQQNQVLNPNQTYLNTITGQGYQPPQ